MATGKEAVRDKQSQLQALTSEYCRANLDDEYDELCRQLIAKMARKRDVPFLSGRLEIWAAATIYAIGTINFLFDRDTQPYVHQSSICEHFGANQTTVGQKSKRIRDMFKMGPFGSEFVTQERHRANPFNRMATVNGMIVMLDP